MSITTLLSEARDRRSAQRAQRAEHEALVRELSAYRTPNERTRIEMLAARSNDPAAAEILDILDHLALQDPRRRWPGCAAAPDQTCHPGGWSYRVGPLHSSADQRHHV